MSSTRIANGSCIEPACDLKLMEQRYINVSNTGVLVIADDRTTRESLRMLLEFEGYLVSSCKSGPAAFELMREQCFEIFLVDYRLTEMNGDEVVRRLHAECPDDLVIGFSMESKGRAFLAAGADAFIGKKELAHKLLPFLKAERKT
jgi:CheY-like chemotaxis protein